MLISVFLIIASTTLAQNQDFIEYIETYKDIAIREMARAGIPASIKLAQAILESGAGTSALARRANNHFGIKCGYDWKGKTYYREDDDFDEKGKLIESCFRSYRDPEASFIAHSEFLRDPRKSERYGFLFRLDPTDYRRWAYGLRQSGYATSATYHEKLIDLIERYELFKFDRMSSIDLVATTDAITGTMTNNDVKYVLATPDESLESVARRTDTTLRSLLKYNEMIDDAEEQLVEGTKVYLQPKRNAFRGRKTWHYVQEGETMYDISQAYGVKMARLYTRNQIPLGKQPAIGARLKLRGCKVKDRPVLASEAALQPQQPMPEIIMDEKWLDMEVVPDPEIEAEPIRDEEKIKTEPDFDEPRPETKPEPVKVDEKPEPKPVDEPPIPDSPSAVYHTVVKGDTLWNISQRYGITVDILKRLNNLTSDNISIGMKLRVR
jgi:LysM repeat protein